MGLFRIVGATLMSAITAGCADHAVTTHDVEATALALDADYDASLPSNAEGPAMSAEQTRHRHLRPILNCVSHDSRGRFFGHFGYDNPREEPITVRRGPWNTFRSLPSNRSQPTTFEPGLHDNAVTARLGHWPVEWRLGSRRAIAHRASAVCRPSFAGLINAGPVSDDAPPRTAGHAARVDRKLLHRS